MFRIRSLAAVLLALLSLVVMQVAAQAQGEPPPVELLSGAVTVELHSVDAVLDGPVASVHVTQIFRNQADWPVEGVYIFPLPPGAVVGDFQMTVDGQVLEGTVYNKEEARRIYEEIVRQRRDPALLEYLGQGLFQTSVFPIPPGASRKLELDYTYTLALQDGLYHFLYPLQTRQYSPSPVKTLSLRIELRNQPGLRTIYSPSHDVRIDRLGGDAALVGYEGSGIQPERDFELYFGVSSEAIGLNLLSYNPAGEDGYFLLLAAPALDVAPDEVVQRDIILVMDVSGSMQGMKIMQARQAAHFLVDNLNPGDRFNLISFSTGTRLWAESLQAQSPSSVAEAHRWIDKLQARGSTDINRALLEALAQLLGDETQRSAYVLFMTDGLPTLGETSAGRIVANALNNIPPGRSVRLFSFGIGYDVDTDLLNDLSSELGGRSSYVRANEGIDEVLGDFYRQISTPVLAQVSIDFPGILVQDAYPYPIPDLFAGEQIVWVGRYRQGGETTVRLQGKVNGRERLFTYEHQHLAKAGGDTQVARLWATRKIGTLLDAIRHQGALPELVDEVVALSTRYGIVTPYTSYMVLESTRQPVEGQIIDDAEVVVKEVQVTVEVEKVVEAPAAGEAAVEASEARQALREAEQVTETQGLRYVAGKAFTQQGYVRSADGSALPLWVDNAYRETMPRQSIVFGSDAYFALAGDASVAAWLAVSPEMVLVIDGTAYRISTRDADGDLFPPAPTVTPDLTSPSTPPSDTGSSFWQTLLDWLRQLFVSPAP